MNGASLFFLFPAPWGGLLIVSLEATVVAGLIVFVQRLMGRRLAPRWRFALWGVFIARLVLPVAPQTGWSLFNLYYAPSRIESALADRGLSAERAVVADESALPSRDIPALEGEEGTVRLSSKERNARSAPAIPAASAAAAPEGIDFSPGEAVRRWMAWLPLVWFLGVVVLLIRLVGESWRFSRRVVRGRFVTDSRVFTILEGCKEAMRVRIFLAVVETPRVDSPSLFGVIRPRLLMPEGLADSLSDEQLRFVFLHELSHLKRRDVAINWVMAAIQAIHWFNPAIWVAFSRMRGDREVACDALALSHLDRASAHDYGRTLVDLMERTVAPRRPTALAALVGVVERNARLKERIGWIAHNDGLPYRRGTLLGMALVFVLGAATLTEARMPGVDWSRSVSVPERNSLALPAVLEGAGSVPLGSGRILAHVFLLHDGVPVAFQEFDIRWPGDKGRQFSFRDGKVDVNFRVTNLAASVDDPADTHVDVKERPYLRVECAGTIQQNGWTGGGSAGFGGASYDRTHAMHSSVVNGFSAVVVLSPAAVDDPIVELPLREFVRDRWRDIAGQLWLRPKGSQKTQDPAAAVRALWGEAAGITLPSAPVWESKVAIYRRRLAEAGGRLGGYSSMIYKVALVDLDTSRTLLFDSAPAEWPAGFDVQYDESTRQFSIRPDSTVRMGRIHGYRNEFEALREAAKQVDQLAASPSPSATGSPVVLTDQGRVAVILGSASGASGGSFFRKAKHWSSFRWFFLNPQQKKSTGSGPGVETGPSSREAELISHMRAYEHAKREMAKAPPPPAGWRERFNAVYHLDKDQVLKRIAPPFIPERAIYYRVEDPDQAAFISDPPSSFYFEWKDVALGNSGGLFTCDGVKPALDFVLRSPLEIGSQEIDDPGNLRKIAVEGDWIVRRNASRGELLRALESILHNELGRNIVFERCSVEREVVLVTGSYSFTPQAGAYSDRCVHIYSDKLDPDEGAGGGSGTLSRFFEWVGDRTAIPFIDETDSSMVKMSWGNHKSSKAAALQEDPRRIDELLDNLHRQTGLTYRREHRKVQVWRIVEKGTSEAAESD